MRCTLTGLVRGDADGKFFILLERETGIVIQENKRWVINYFLAMYENDERRRLFGVQEQAMGGKVPY